MKIKVLLGALLLTACGDALAELQPTVWADIPDVAPLRVGDTYYMTSTTMHFNPGIPVMASKDLIDWKTVGYCYDTLENRDEDNLANGRNDYMFGTWASSIRFNAADGCFYVSSFNNRAKHTYLFRAKDVTGPWERFIFTDRLVYDHSLWIEDGKFYFFGSDHGRVYLHKIKDDLSGIEATEPKLVCPDIRNNLRGGLAEGSQVFKKDGWYYLVNICWPGGKCRLVNVHRAKSMEGPFVEAHVAFEHEGIAQGSFIEKTDGSWVAVLFGDRGGVGRVPFILPVEWRDGWPVVLPRNDYVASGVPSCVANDDFESAALKLEWQWNHNPDQANWRLADGTLKITTARVDDDLLKVRNILTQRTFGPTCEARVKVDGSALKTGDKAGLALFQQHWGAISLQKTEKGYDIVLDLPPLKLGDRRIFRPRGDAPTREVLRRSIGDKSFVYLKAVCDFTPLAHRDYCKIPDSQDTGRFYYSLDGERWEAIGEVLVMPYTVPHFTGYRFALFNWATAVAGGTAAFDDFMLDFAKPGETMRSDGTNPIIKTRFTADPAGVVVGDYFYLFMGHDDPSAHGYRMFDWTMARTKDMKNWEDFGPVMSVRETFPWARPDGAWASHAIEHKGKWYWYVAVFDKKTRKSCVAVAVADKPEGPWTDPNGKPLVIGDGFIDPAVFVDDDGSAWLFWGNCGGDPGCWYGKLKESMTELDGGYRPVPGLMDEKAFGKPLVKTRGAGVRRPARANTNFEEAPWVYRLGDTYYLEYAAGGVPENWSYSTAKSIHGPWTYRGKIMDNAGGTGTIHGGSVLFKGQWYMVYHDGRLPGGADCRRSVRIEPYTRNPDGSIPFIKPTWKGVAR
ncbi:MAG: family 43 glycosylhydrolase [Kiritimatiellia bacterium]